MNLPDISIRRPVLAIVLSIIPVLFGVVSLSKLGVREYPAVDPPIITVTTRYPGANPEVIESQITEPIEQVLNGIDGIRILSSTSREEQSQIRVEFDIETDLETAANDVRDKVSQAQRQLPDDADPPTVEKSDADSEPILFVTVRSERRSILEVNDFATNVLKERIQTIPGVSTVRIFGEKKYAMRLWMDPVRLAAHNLTPLDVENAVARQNIDLPSGRLEGDTVEITLQTSGRLNTPEEYNRMIVYQGQGRSIRFDDIGYAELGAENLRGSNKNLGVPQIGVAIIPQPNTNAVAIADEFYKRLEGIRLEAPKDYVIDVGYDFTAYVRRSIREVEETLFIAFALVALIIFAFLRDWRSTIVPVIAIPVSIIAAFAILYFAGFSINILTLVGIVLSIGLVCDDAIVVLENIYAKIEQGMSPLQAASQGSKEVYFAVISTTITLAAVFVPIVFLRGLTGRLFREFGVTIVGAVLISAFVALTLTPMMCRFLLRHHEKHNPLYRITEPFFAGMTQLYRSSLRWVFAHRWTVVPVVAINAAIIFFIGKQLPTELAPLEDRSNIRVTTTAPEGATYEYMSRFMDVFALRLADEIPEISRTFSITGARGGAPNNGLQNIYLTEPSERERTQQEVFRDVSRISSEQTAFRAFPSQPPTIGQRSGGQPLQYVLQAPTMDRLLEVMPKVLDEAGDSPLLRFVDADLKINRPQSSLTIDRDRAAELNISVVDVARTLQAAYAGSRYGYFLKDGKQYQVIGQMQRDDRNDPDDLKKIYVRTASGRMVSLDNLVRIDESVSPAAIYRFNRYVSATISGQPAPGYTLGQALEEIERISKKHLTPGMTTDVAGQSRDLRDSSSSLIFAFLLAIVLIYLVLAAQFESFIDPVTILLTVPMSVAGAVLTLWMFGQTLNVFSQIGVIMLIGLVTKNGILIVEFANQRKEQGMRKLEAILDASVARLRPILMTSFATVLGILPIALSLGTASGSRQSLGIAVVGGMILSGLLTLYVIPVAYSFLSRETAPETAAAKPTAAIKRLPVAH